MTTDVQDVQGDLDPRMSTPTMGEGCDLAVALEVGARTVCRDGRCGRVAKLVIDPSTDEVTGLIIEKGFLQKRDRVVPIEAVVAIAEGEVTLDMEIEALGAYPEYQEVSYHVPATGWNHVRYRPEDVRYPLSPYEGLGGESVAPSRRHAFHKGIDFGSTVIEAGTRVRCPGGGAGVVDHVLVDCERGHITHLVVKRGVRADYRIVPVAAIAQVGDDGVLLHITQKQVQALPAYRPHK